MMTKMNNKQELEQNAVVFITYMIGASYFNVKPECSSSIIEDRMELYYREIPTKKQMLFESICDSYMQNVLKNIPDRMWDMRAVVQFKSTKLPTGGISFEVVFETWEFEFTLSGVCNEKGRVDYSNTLRRYSV